MTDDLEWWIIKQKNLRSINDIFRSESDKRPWCNYFLKDSPYYPGNLNSKCRIGFVPFDEILQDRFYIVDTSRTIEILAAGGITTQMFWDGSRENLPDGWQGAVRQSFLDYFEDNQKPNVLVAMLAFTTQRFRKQGLSGVMLSKMIESAKESGFDSLLVPALPPAQFEKDYVDCTMTELSEIKRDDGKYYDYWARLHTDKGAEIIGVSDSSHRFCYNLEDFSKYVSSTPITSTGDILAVLDKDEVLGPNRKNMYCKVHADIEKDIVFFNWGCIWMHYQIS